MTEITYALFGDYKVGKTAFIVRHQTGEFIKHHKSVDGISLRLLDLNTSKGKIQLTITENCVNEDCEGIMVMFDVTNKDSFRYSVQVVEKFNQMCPNIPIILMGNKVDVIMRTVLNRDIEERIKAKDLNIIAYTEMSVASMYSLDIPFQELLAHKFKDIEMNDVDVNITTSMEDSDDIGDKENVIMLSDHE